MAETNIPPPAYESNDDVTTPALYEAPPSYSDIPEKKDPSLMNSDNVVIQQEPRTVFVTQVVQAPQRNPDISAPLCFSFVVMCCCCCPLGLVALIYALTSRNARSIEQAQQKVRVSNQLNIAGVVCGLVFITLRVAYILLCPAGGDMQ